MAKAARAGWAPLHRSLPDEIVIWEILVRLPRVSLLRCRAVCCSWRRITTTREFLLSHHGYQPNLPVGSSQRNGEEICKNIVVFDHRAAPPDAQLQPVARLDGIFYLEASCDGLLVLFKSDMTGAYISVCNPATRQHAPLRQLRGFTLLGMYPHRPTGEYRLLLQRNYRDLPTDQLGCHVFVLGSDQPPRYIGGTESPSALVYETPALVCDSLHLFPKMQHHCNSRLVVFDTKAESFRQMHAPIVTTKSYMFEMDGKLGIYSPNYVTKIVNIWVLQNYQSEVWELNYQVELPAAEIMSKFGGRDGYWRVTVASVDGGVLLLVNFDRWLFYVDTDGELVASFQNVYASQLQQRQTLIEHTFFTALDGYVVNAPPFI